MAEETKSLHERLQYLEEQNEGLKRVGILGLVLLLILGLVVVYESWSSLGGVTTRGLVLTDSDKTMRAAVLVGPGGHVGLVPFDVTGRLPVLQTDSSLGLQGLGVYDSRGRIRVMIGVTGQDEPVLAVVGPNGELTWTALEPTRQPSPGVTPSPGATPGATPSPAATPPPPVTPAPATPQPTP